MYRAILSDSGRITDTDTVTIPRFKTLRPSFLLKNFNSLRHLLSSCAKRDPCALFVKSCTCDLQDRDRLMELLTYPAVEESIKRRVETKAKTYGQEVTANVEEDGADPIYKIKPSIVADLYGDWIMPLTKEVQVEYLLRRLD